MGCKGKKDQIKWRAIPAKDGSKGTATIQLIGRCKLHKLHYLGVKTPLVANKSKYVCTGCGRTLASHPEPEEQPARLALCH